MRMNSSFLPVYQSFTINPFFEPIKLILSYIPSSYKCGFNAPSEALKRESSYRRQLNDPAHSSYRQLDDLSFVLCSVPFSHLFKRIWRFIWLVYLKKWGEVVRQRCQRIFGSPSLWTPTTSQPIAHTWSPRITWGAWPSFIPCQHLCSSCLWLVQPSMSSLLHVQLNTRSSARIWTTSWWTWPWQTSLYLPWAPSPVSTALPSDTWFWVHWGARLKDLQQLLVVRSRLKA